MSMTQSEYIQQAHQERSQIATDCREVAQGATAKLLKIAVREAKWQKYQRGGGFGISNETAVREAAEYIEGVCEQIAEDVKNLLYARVDDL